MKLIIAVLAVLALSRSSEAHSVPVELSSLHDDLEEFVALVPKDKIKDLFYDYLSDDADFGEAIDYLTSNEFKAVWEEFFSIPEVQHFVDYLQSAGLDAKGFIQKVKDLLFNNRRIAYYPVFGLPRVTGGLPGFLKDVKALIPVDAVNKLYEEKLVSSKDFAAFIDKLKSQEFQQLVNKVVSNAKVQEFMKRAQAKGVDFKAIVDFLKTLFPFHRFHFELSSLNDDFDDFMKLVPTEQIKKLFYKYLAEDSQFQESFAYLTSDEFKYLLIEIGYIPEVQEFIDYLESSGVEVLDFIEKVKRALGFDDLKIESRFRSLKLSGGLSGFFKDVEALLPFDEIKDMYEEKMHSSTEFSGFIEKLQSPEFQTLVDKVFGNLKFQNLLKRAEAKGVDIQRVLDFITNLLGIHFPKRPTLF